MLQILAIIAPSFLIIFASAFLRKFTGLGLGWDKPLNEYALKIGFPVLIFSALARAPFSFGAEAGLIGMNSLYFVLTFALVFLGAKLLRLEKKMFLTLFICSVFGNVAYLGMPVMTSVFGEAIRPRASLIIAVYLFWIFTVGIACLEYFSSDQKKNILKNLLKNLSKNPLLMAVIFGLMVGASRLEIPSVILQSLDMISASVTPTVLIVIGLFVGNTSFGRLSDWLPATFFSFFTLVLFPAGLYGLLNLFGFSPSDFATSIVQAAMPLAITPFALAERYPLEKIFIARSVVLSTILASVTLPFWIQMISQ